MILNRHKQCHENPSVKKQTKDANPSDKKQINSHTLSSKHIV